MTSGVLKRCWVTRFSGCGGDAGLMVGLDDLGGPLYDPVLPCIPCAQQGRVGHGAGTHSSPWAGCAGHGHTPAA